MDKELSLTSNPVLECSGELLELLCHLQLPHEPLINDDLSLLLIKEEERNTHEEIINALDTFRKHAIEVHDSIQEVEALHYMFCASLDEAFNGNALQLNHKFLNLVADYYHSHNGGEIFFDYLEKYKNNKKEFVELTYLAFVELAVGFKGKYALLKNGPESLTHAKQALFEIISRKNQETIDATVNEIRVSERMEGGGIYYAFKKIGVAMFASSVFLITSLLYIALNLLLDTQLEELQNEVNVTSLSPRVVKRSIKYD